MKRISYLGAVTASAIAVSLAGAASAADEPDISGVWQAYASVPQFGPGQAAALSEAGAATVDAYFAQYGDDFPSPGPTACRPACLRR